jgi:hypothetical protein
VLDLESGSVIAEEMYESEEQALGGFCPVGFYVPDWWDLHDGSLIPGSEYWDANKEWPNGDFGFVWGCQWGDDSSWKVQYLDLSQIQQGVLRREERFGYLELATFGFENPCFELDAAIQNSAPPPFIHVWRRNGEPQVSFAVRMTFDLDTGWSGEWQRLKIANFE